MLKGSLEEFALSDIFRLLSFTKKTGKLDVVRAAGNGTVYFKGGDVYFAESTLTREPLGQKLIRAGVLTERELMAALDEHAQSGKRVGEILVNRGTITQEHLEAAIQGQVEDATFDLLRWDIGEFAFEATGEVVAEIPISVSVENLIMEASRRLDELASIERKIPSAETILRVAETPPEGAHEINITPEEWRLLVLVDGVRTIAEIGAAAKVDDFSALQILHGLVSAGLVEVAPEDEERPATAGIRKVTSPPASAPPAYAAPPGPAADVTAATAEQDRQAAEAEAAEAAARAEAERAEEEARLAAEREAAERAAEEDRLAAEREAAERAAEEARLTAEREAAERAAEEDRLAAEREAAEQEAAEAAARAEAERAEEEARLATERTAAEEAARAEREAADSVPEELFAEPDIPDVPPFPEADEAAAAAARGSDSDSFLGSFLEEDPAPPTPPAPEPAEPTETAPRVDRAAVVRELASLFSDEEPVRRPRRASGSSGSEEPQNGTDDLDAPKRVEDDDQLNKGLINRLIDGVKGL